MHGLSETRYNTCSPIRCKACLFHSHFIGADSKLRCSKEPLLIRCYSTGLIGQGVVQRNFRVGNDSAAGVAHNALKSCSNSRGLSGGFSRAKEQDKRYGDPDCNMTHGKRTASQNHLESPSPMNSWKNKETCLGRAAARTALHGAINGRSYTRVLFGDLLSQTSRYAVGGEGDSSHQKAAK